MKALATFRDGKRRMIQRGEDIPSDYSDATLKSYQKRGLVGSAKDLKQKFAPRKNSRAAKPAETKPASPEQEKAALEKAEKEKAEQEKAAAKNEGK